MMEHMVIETGNAEFLALISEPTRDIFEGDNLEPKPIIKSKRGYVPWGEDNQLPFSILDKLRKNDVMNPNILFNILTGYGAGFRYKMSDESEIPEEVKSFFDDNDMTLYLLEQQTDMKHFYITFVEIILSNDHKKITDINHLEATSSRIETCDPKTGKIENIFYADWTEEPAEKDVTAIPLLDYRKPYKSLKELAKKNKNVHKYAMMLRIPIPGKKYYPIPYYSASFKSGWYDIYSIVPIAKKAQMTNGLKVRYHIEIHQEYFPSLYREENISDPEKQLARKKKEYENIQKFLTGYENQGKLWFSTYYVDPNGKEQSMVRITRVDTTKEGGDYIEDVQEASSMLCYSQGVHPNLNGATPGKSGSNISGTDKRELFTMKQALEKPFRDILMQPLRLVKRFNEWPDNLVLEIPDLMLTTLDKGTDAKEQTLNTENNAPNNN